MQTGFAFTGFTVFTEEYYFLFVNNNDPKIHLEYIGGA